PRRQKLFRKPKRQLQLNEDIQVDLESSKQTLIGYESKRQTSQETRVGVRRRYDAFDGDQEVAVLACKKLILTPGKPPMVIRTTTPRLKYKASDAESIRRSQRYTKQYAAKSPHHASESYPAS